ncbi:hypothetical protein VMCG_10821 [Cytospora schulzeri]|uniref:Rhodopsin domain-containing protein n=1 Tax=Cytospora schulzeri TaxID=448051 RepID=A0A423V8G1_9PEZI|nr:hypothetical protein VMCG_10821 [Valsa malicola]
MSSSASTAPPSVIGINHLQYGLTWTLTGLAIIAVAGRCHLKLKFKLGLVIEDYLMILALALQISYQAGFTLMCNWGSGRPSNTLTAEQNFNINKWSWIFAVPGFLVSIIARVSIAILLVRIFGSVKLFKSYMISFTTIQTIVGLVSIVLLVAQCDPYEGLWNKAVIRRYWDKRIYQYTALALQFFFVISDITYVLFPVMVIWKLHMPTRRKIGLLVVMAMSLVTMCAAVAKITVSLIPMTNNKILGDPAVQYFTSIINFSSDCEQALVIIMGCIPTLHLANRLRVPSLKELRGNVSKIFSWSDRRKSSRYRGHKESVETSSTKPSFPGSQKGYSGYHEIQLTPLVCASNPERFDSTRRALSPRGQSYVTSQGSLPRVDGDFSETRVLRTDSFSVSYKPHRLVEEV